MTKKTSRWVRIFSLLWLSSLASTGVIGKSITVSLPSPTGEPFPHSINVSGSFNQWQMNAESTMTWSDSTKTYQFNIPQSESAILFNIYKEGDWQNPLATEFGKPFTCGFIVSPDDISEIKPEFFGWANDSTAKANNTVTGELITLTDFPMPQLDRSGNIYLSFVTYGSRTCLSLFLAVKQWLIYPPKGTVC